MTPLQVQLVAPIVCRSAGLPFDWLERFRGESDRQTLWRLLDEEKFVDCLATMHHGSLASLRSRRASFKPDRRPSDVRRSELTIYRYLVRMASRNDTTGTAGSTCWGQFGRGHSRLASLPAPSLTRVVWTSPRHLELLCHEAAHGPLREKARVVLFPRYTIRGGELVDSHEQLVVKADVELLGRLPLAYASLTPREREAVDGLVERSVVTLRLGEPGQQLWDALLKASHDSAWGEPLANLEALRLALESSSGWDFAVKMEQADGLASQLSCCRSLNAPHLLRHLFHRALKDPGLNLQLAPPAARRSSHSARESELIELLADGPRPVTQLSDYLWELVHCLEEGMVAPQGALDFRPGWPWRVRFDELARLLAASVSDRALKRSARLLCAAHPCQPVRVNPLAAEARLLAENPQPEHIVAGYDRSFFICDSSRSLDFTIGPRLRQRLEQQLQPWFRLAGWQEYCRERQLRPLLRYLGDQGEMGLSRFLERFAVLQTRAPDEIRAELAFLRQEIVYQDECRWSVHGDPASFLEIRESAAKDDFESWLSDKRLVTTLDLMLGGSSAELEAGAGTILIAEAHCGAEGLGLTTFFPHSHPARVENLGAREIFGEHTLFLQPPVPSKQSAGILYQLQDMALALNNPEGWWPQQRTVPIGRLGVRASEQGLRVMDGDRPYRLITPDLTMGNIRTVGYSPSSLGDSIRARLPGFTQQGVLMRCPEIRLNNLILARASVRLPALLAQQALSEDPRGSLLRGALDLPRFSFMQTRWKPMLFDFESHLSMEVLMSELAKAETVSFSPMQPAPDELWLKLAEGRFTSELRLVAMAQGARFEDGPAGCQFFLDR